MKTHHNPVSSQIANAANIESEAYLKKVLQKKTIRAFVMVILGSMLYSVGVAWILQLGGFFSSGVTGTAQIIVRLPELWGGESMDSILGILIGLINVPLLILGWRGVSKRYVSLTITSIVVQSLTTTLLSNFTVTPFVDLLTGSGEGLIDAIKNGMLNVFDMSPEKIARVEAFKANIYDSSQIGIRIVLAVMGGGVTGIAASTCLKAGGSTGGVDIVSSFLQMKKRVSFTKYSSMIDALVISLSALFSLQNVIYTLLRLFIYIMVIDKVYSSYKITRIEVITSKGEELRKTLINKYHHGITIFEATGGYTLSKRQVLETYVSKYEVYDYLRTIQQVDPGAFVVTTKVKIAGGKYIQKTIV